MIVEVHDKAKRSALCRNVLEALPDWFGNTTARESYICRSKEMTVFSDPQERCFAGLQQHSEIHAEIAVMGVKPHWHRKGLGTALIMSARRWAKRRGIGLLSVKTLSARAPDEFYSGTRRFYAVNGFRIFEELPDLWDAQTPCVILVLDVNHAEVSTP